MDAQRVARELRRDVDRLDFGAPVTHVYNPLDYARARHAEYLKRYARSSAGVLLLGMNPGPFGMAQTGVPFGEVELVRTWLGIEGRVKKPTREHPRRPIEGFGCTRSEVSGRRFWGWARERFGTPERFFRRFFVWNYCPLVFMEDSGRNRTPDKLPPKERNPLFAVCDRALQRIVACLEPELVVGIGRFAERQAGRALNTDQVTIGQVLHPSPASPSANRGWAQQVEQQLAGLGIAVD